MTSVEIRGIKNFVLKGVFLFLPFVVLVAAVNSFIDPAHLYMNKDRYARGIAEILLSGQNVGGISNFDERIMEKAFIARQKVLPEIVVIGSSRAMQIGSNIFPGKNIFNNSVSSASLADYLGILFNYDKKGDLPKIMIIGLDPWDLDPKSGEDRWESFRGDTLSMLKKLEVSSKAFKRPLISPQTTNILSLTYFRSAIDQLLRGNSSVKGYFPTVREKGDFDIIHKDGRRSNAKSWYKTAQDVKKSALNAAMHPEKYFLPQRPDPELENILDKAVSYLQSKHVRIIFFLPPYHPIVYNSFLQPGQDGLIDEIENYYRRIAQKHHIKVIGSYDPSKLGLSGDGFYDGYHPSKESVEKIFKQDWQGEIVGS